MLVGGFEAILLRIQLAVPHNNFLSPEVFNRIFTMHGTTMVFLMGMPLIIGFANYLVPLMIGARDMAFPRMNAFSFWMTALGGLMLYYSFIGGVGLQGAGSAPDVTWWAYAPLTERAFSRGHSTDYWALSLIVSGFGTIGAAVNIIATTICMRCKGMTHVSHAAAGMALPGGLGNDPGHHQPADRGADHADHRPLSRGTLLRLSGWRRARRVGALFLDLRPPRGVRAGVAGVRDCQRGDSGLSPARRSLATRRWCPRRPESA